MREPLSSIQNLLTRRLQLRLDVHETVVLGHSLTTGRGSRLQMAGGQRNRDISNEVISRLS